MKRKKRTPLSRELSQADVFVRDPATAVSSAVARHRTKGENRRSAQAPRKGTVWKYHLGVGSKPPVSRKPPETQGKRIRCLERTMVEKNGKATPRILHPLSASNFWRFPLQDGKLLARSLSHLCCIRLSLCKCVVVWMRFIFG